MRQEINLNQAWMFSKTCTEVPGVLPENQDEWEVVNLPHCWNSVDGMTGVQFDRGAYWYVRTFKVPVQPRPGGRIYVEVGAAAQTGEIWINGQFAAKHVGGYSAFRADITELLQERENTLAILVDNRYSDHVYPQRADFTFYGGLYRYVKLVSVAKSHISMAEYGGPGIYIDAEPSNSGAQVGVRVKLEGVDEQQRVCVQLFRPGQTEPLAESWDFAESDNLLKLFLPNVKLWDGVKSPEMYTALVRLVSHNEVLDEITCDFGVRSFYLDSRQGFFLNGHSYQLRGVCRHQDRLYLGNALSMEDAWEDASIIAEMGANTVRLAHYQQAQEMYDACDVLGLVVWAEIPYFTQSWDREAHTAAVNEIRELVAQNYNHPSIFFWGLSNEVLMAGNDHSTLMDCHRDLNEAVKALDSHRLTVVAHEGRTPWEHPLHDLSDAEGWNHYYGWYRGEMDDLAKWCDDYHLAYPDRAFAVSEYGCDSVITFHSDDPAKMDYTEEYQVLIHENACETWSSRPWIWGTFVWNMFDFGSAFRREGGTMGRNNKGMVSMDRKLRKDSFYVYKAWFSKEPFVHIDGRRYFNRPGDWTTVRIHSNQMEVELFVDGKSMGVLGGEHTFVFENVPISCKGTVLTARAGDCSDSITIRGGAADTKPFNFPAFTHTRDAINWFESVEEAAASLERVPGCFSVHDSVEELFANEASKKAVLDGLTAACEREVPDQMLTEVDISMSLVDAISQGFVGVMLHDKDTEQVLRRIHTVLSTIEK